MSSVSPESSVSQLVYTTGGHVVVPPSEVLLSKLAPDVASDLLSKYYAAVVAVSASTGGSEASASFVSMRSSGSSRPGKRERKQSALLRADVLRDQPGNCYLQLVSDAKVPELAAKGGPITLGALFKLQREYARPAAELSGIGFSEVPGGYHVEKGGTHDAVSFMQRCASLRRGCGDVLGNAYGVASFGAEPVAWDGFVGGDVAKAVWSEVTSPGVFGLVVDSPFVGGEAKLVEFPKITESVFVKLGFGAEMQETESGRRHVGPTWVKLHPPGPAQAYVRVPSSLTAWWANVRTSPPPLHFLPDGRYDVVEADYVSLNGNYERVQIRSLRVDDCDVSVRVTAALGVGLRYFCVSRGGDHECNIDDLLLFLQHWKEEHGVDSPLAVEVCAGEACAVFAGHHGV